MPRRLFAKTPLVILRARGVLPASGPCLEDGALVLSGGRIQAVGPWPSLRQSHGGKATDLGEVLLLPGLINSHCHLDYTDLAGMLEPRQPFSNWIKALVALKATWGYSEYALSWLHGAAMLCRHGVTTVADVEAVPELLPDLWATTPLRVISFLELLNIRSWHSARQLVSQAEAKLASLPQRDGRVGLAPHAPYTTSPDLLRHAAATARRRGWPLTCHAAESREEFDMFARGRGPLYDWLAPQRGSFRGGLASPIRFLARQKVLGAHLLAVHVNYLAEGDLGLLADHQVNVVHCPRSHAFFAHQRFPIRQLLAAGVNVCLGTDSLASIESSRRQPAQLDLLAEVRTLATHELHLSPETLLRLATVNGARALGQEKRLGELSRGAAADLIAIPFATKPSQALETVLAHEGPVSASMIAGQWVIPPRTAG